MWNLIVNCRNVNCTYPTPACFFKNHFLISVIRSNRCWHKPVGSITSCWQPTFCNSVLATKFGRNWEHEQLFKTWQICFLFYSSRNSPTFKSFEEKVETTVTSLKVWIISWGKGYVCSCSLKMDQGFGAFTISPCDQSLIVPSVPCLGAR